MPRRFPNECCATGQACVYGPHGPGGAIQCEFCGAQQDDPPREAAEVLRAWLTLHTGAAAAAVLHTMRDTLPDDARWRLAAWIVADLEPTMEMRMSISDAIAQTVMVTLHGDLEISQKTEDTVLRAMLAAARAEGARDD